MNKTATGATSYTDAERKRDEDDRKWAAERQHSRRKARRSGQNYNKPASRQHQRAYSRMVGSE